MLQRQVQFPGIDGLGAALRMSLVRIIDRHLHGVPTGWALFSIREQELTQIILHVLMRQSLLFSLYRGRNCGTGLLIACLTSHPGGSPVAPTRQEK